ncbi:alpha/beta fold hydrolase [Labrys neptuniae]
MRNLLRILTLSTLLVPASNASAEVIANRPTIILVHGAFAESSSWNGVITDLAKQGYRTIAAANPLRSVAGDAAGVSALVQSIQGPVVLVGHSYGGTVITEAADGQKNVKALVYVAAFAPDVGESSLTLSGRFEGSTLGGALLPISVPGGKQELYIQPGKFHAQFAADVPADLASLMAATQRPITPEALAEPAHAASWKTIRSYAVYGSADRNIPEAAMKFMAERVHAVRTVVVKGASHAVMVSHPGTVAALIEEAAASQ